MIKQLCQEHGHLNRSLNTCEGWKLQEYNLQR